MELTAADAATVRLRACLRAALHSSAPRLLLLRILIHLPTTLCVYHCSSPTVLSSCASMLTNASLLARRMSAVLTLSRTMSGLRAPMGGWGGPPLLLTLASGVVLAALRVVAAGECVTLATTCACRSQCQVLSASTATPAFSRTPRDWANTKPRVWSMQALQPQHPLIAQVSCLTC